MSQNPLLLGDVLSAEEHVQIKHEGEPETLDYRGFFVDTTIPPWHDVPLLLRDGVSNFTVEILKESSAKMEVATDEPHSH
ncbi:hypothetical protein GOBAR_DD23489 [Gossypium barbadense]|nr:hypothetical protein GOBAR_DD23489 [Gossypium barbadense]